jgi:hypothetical protein
MNPTKHVLDSSPRHLDVFAPEVNPDELPTELYRGCGNASASHEAVQHSVPVLRQMLNEMGKLAFALTVVVERLVIPVAANYVLKSIAPVGSFGEPEEGLVARR